MSSVVLVPPISKSEIEELPERLREILLKYITPLYKSISVLLRSTNEDEFERNLKAVTSDFLEYSALMGLALSEEHRMFVLRYYLKHSQGAAAADKTLLAQTIADANEIIANFIWLTTEPKYLDLIPQHPGVYSPFLKLLVYNTILTYISDIPEKEVEPSMAKKIIRKTQETTWTVEGYVDTIEILADPEASAALERIKQTSISRRV
jgi:hypothetical protein